MRIVTVSDIHGNIVGMQAVLKEISSLGGYDKLFIAGDTVSGSSGNSDLINLLLDHNAEFIRGNVEDFLSNPKEKLKLVPARFRLYMKTWFSWLTDKLTEEEWNLLVNSPINKSFSLNEEKSILVCHASSDNPWSRTCSSEQPKETLIDVYGKCKEDIIVYGHNHNNHIIQIGTKILVNTASVGMRKDGKSYFTIIEERDGNIDINQQCVEYDTGAEIRLNLMNNIPAFHDLVKNI